ncbi:MAG: polyprenyl synthetase family protein [Acidimicrobiia bacterium]|nr:polyprenyl synthetase family protein [Acidimicrobiia bacterium]
MTDTPPALDIVGAGVEDRLRGLFDDEQRRWADVHVELPGFLATVRGTALAGGKRLRPAFCAWGAAAAGADINDPAVVDAGAALELLHAFALVHDDVMDGSDRRRGEPTVHVDAAGHHASSGWRGESRRYGDAVAILAGDYLHVMADHLVAAASPDAVTLWRDLRTELNIGQYLDVAATARGAVDPETATLVTRYKSGLYTIERPLELGCILAGDADLGRRLAIYGRPLGEAFQLRDDVLGSFGDEVLVGKPVGDDLREGKPTLLLAFAHERADSAQHEVLAGVGGDLDHDDVARIQNVLVDTGALDRVEAHITARTTEALAALDQLGLPDEPHAALVELAHFVSARRF